MFGWRDRVRRGGLTVGRWFMRGVALVLLLGLLVAGLAWALVSVPASWFVSSVERVSGERLRLANVQGSVRAGSAEVWLRDAPGREWLPWQPITWQASLELGTPDGWPRLGVNSSLGRITLDRHVVSLQAVRVAIPPSMALVFVNHPLAKAPWRGDLVVQADQWRCALQGKSPPNCSGSVLARWQGAGSPLLPMDSLGDYVVTATVNGQSAQVQVRTERGVVQVGGTAQVQGQHGSYRLSVVGATAQIGGLDAIAAGGVRKVRSDEKESEFLIEGRF